ncbi:MAG TPA: M15 family metallopeptidase [Gemmatimonadaceae bacterium]|nr:M15 family metallopeptidase [Gemmatimonadaceae bacterium]
MTTVRTATLALLGAALTACTTQSPSAFQAPAGVAGASASSAITELLVPAAPGTAIGALVGLYAAGADTVVVLEDGGRLLLMSADSVRRPLAPLDSALARFAIAGRADTMRVERAGGAVRSISAGGATYARLHVAPGDGGFRIVPRRPVEELRREALAATPPAQPSTLRAADLVDVTTLDPTIRLDVRYATANNFMGARFYDTPRAFLQRPAAGALARAAARLRPLGYGLLVHDAYRPWYVTRMFWDATPDHQRDFVANPANGSRHNRGAAVDLTLYDLATGEPVEMPSGYDEFSPRAAASWPGGTARERAHRDLLRRAMEAEGFDVYRPEWWHFDHETWREYPVMNVRFEEIGCGVSGAGCRK